MGNFRKNLHGTKYLCGIHSGHINHEEQQEAPAVVFVMEFHSEPKTEVYFKN